MDQTQVGRGAVLVTGVSGGIGRAIAEALAEAGYRVYGSVRNERDAAALAGRIVPLVFDVTDGAALSRAVARIEADVGAAGLQALVNNAGVSIAGPLAHQPMAELRKTFDVNVFGLLDVTRACLPLLGAGGVPRVRPGRIVNIGSVQGAFSVPFMGSYAAAKHAVEALGQALRRELLPSGIEVSTIEPSFIRTGLFDKAAALDSTHPYRGTRYAEAWERFNASLRRDEANAPSPERVVRAVLHAIESPRPKTRYPLHSIWYIGRWLPDRWFDRLILKATGLDTVLCRRSGAAR